METETDRWDQIIKQEKIIITNENCMEYLDNVLLKQPYPHIFAPVAVLTIQMAHIIKTRRILEEIIRLVKQNKTIPISELNRLNNDLLILYQEQQNELEKLNQTFNMDCGITVESSDLIVFINERLVHDSNQIKELLQYNDKMKFDKWLKSKHLETREHNWICERKLLPMSPNFEVINESEPDDAASLVINEDDIVVINEADYTI